MTLYESSQGVVNHHSVMASVLGLPPENVEIISRFIGSGFGGKLFPWPHSALCAVAARELNRPVKLVVSRKMMFQDVGHRPRTQQHIRLGATPDGKLLSLQQDYRNHTSQIDDIRENCGEATPFLYSTANLPSAPASSAATSAPPPPCAAPAPSPASSPSSPPWTSSPSSSTWIPSSFASASTPSPTKRAANPSPRATSRSACRSAPRSFGWSKRTPQVGSMAADGDIILGWGVACASWGAGRGPSQCSVSLLPDGTARVSSATQDIGTGTYTVVAQVVTDKTGIPVDKVEVVLGDSSSLPAPCPEAPPPPPASCPPSSTALTPP